jgi:hypothetical protein
MNGFVTKMTVVRHPVLVFRLGGFKLLLACWKAPKGSTFLAILVSTGVF